MYLLDSNVWIAQTFNSHPAHSAASQVLTLATPDRPAIFCRATEQSFLRLASTPALHQQYGAAGLTNEHALQMLDRFLALPTVAYQEEPIGLVPIWHRLARRPVASPKLWMDAYLAAFAIAGQLTMVTSDNGFEQFQSAGLQLQLLAVA